MSNLGLTSLLNQAGNNDTEAKASPPAFDAAKYRADVAEFDFTQEQATAFLEALWSVMCGFVELGISYDVCGQLTRDAEQVLTNGAASVKSNDQTS